MGKKRAYSAKPSITSGDRCLASLPGLALLLSMGAGGGPWGPQATGLMPAALGQITTATGPNPVLSSSTPSESAGQVNPGCPGHDASRGTAERFRTHTCISCPRIQAATIHSVTHKCMQRLETLEDLQPPHIGCANIQGQEQ